MKYNLSDILNDIDVEETEAIADHIKINYNETITEKVKERVLTENREKEAAHRMKPHSMKTIIAFAAVIAIILCSITAVAATSFDMGSTFSRVFTDNKTIDMNTFAKDIHVVSESNGYKFEMTQVICDGRTIYCAFDCPTENGEMLVPVNDEDINITINGKKPDSYLCGFYIFNKICYLEFRTCDEDHIKSNSKIHLDFNKIGYNYALNREDIAEKLLATGKATEAEVDEALNSENDLAIYELADARLDQTPVSIDGEWSFDFKVGDTNVIRTIDTDKVYPYDENNYIEISPLGVYVFSFNPNTIPPIDFKNIFCIEMKDGKVYTDKDTVEVENGYHDGVKRYGYSDSEKDEYRFFTYFALAEFINPDEVKSVSYYDTVIYENK